MGRLSYRPIALDDLEPYAEFLADQVQRSQLDARDVDRDNAASIAVARKLGAVHERDTDLRGGPVSIYVSLA